MLLSAVVLAANALLPTAVSLVPVVLACKAAKDTPGEHSYGAAVDIESVGGGKTFRLVKAAIEVGFERIGISRKKGFIHLGIGYPGAPLKTIWTY